MKKYFPILLLLIFGRNAAAVGQVSIVKGGPNSGLPITAADRAKDEQANFLGMESAEDFYHSAFAAAESDAKQSLALGGGPGTAAIFLPLALAGQGKDDAAMKDYAQLEASRHTEPEILLPYASLLLKHGQYSQALEAYQKAVPRVSYTTIEGKEVLADSSVFDSRREEPGRLEANIDVYLGLVGVYCGFGTKHYSPERQMAEFKKALDLEPGAPLTNLAYAYGLKQLNREPEAIAVYKKVVDKYTGVAKSSAQQEIVADPTQTIHRGARTYPAN